MTGSQRRVHFLSLRFGGQYRWAAVGSCEYWATGRDIDLAAPVSPALQPELPGSARHAAMFTEPSSAHTATELRVRYAETDQMGVVYHANYLVWFEIGRTDFCRAHGFAYREMEQHDGLYIMVAEAKCRYKAPARYDDDIRVLTHLRDVRKRVLVFAYEVYRLPEEELLAEGETVHVITDREGRPRVLPEKYRDLFLAGLNTPEV